MVLSKPVVRSILFSLLMVVCATITDAGMDVLSSRYEKSIFSHWPNQRGWWDPQLSWKNKWKDGDPRQGPAFPLSTTTLVTVTDGWHFLKTCTIGFILAGLLAPFSLLVRLRWFAWLGVLLVVYQIYGLVFESCYNFLFMK
jgi:hypothetical protein